MNPTFRPSPAIEPVRRTAALAALLAGVALTACGMPPAGSAATVPQTPGASTSSTAVHVAAAPSAQVAPSTPSLPPSLPSALPTPAVSAAPDVAPLPGAPARPPRPGPDPVEVLVGDARCRADADCRSASAGEQACGGPAGFFAWSTRVTDERALAAALQARDAQQRRAAAAGGRVSTCQVRTDPGARCEQPAGRCVLRSEGSLPVR